MTTKSESVDSLIKVRAKKKWQIALRRYVVEKQFSSAYAPYFGIDIQGFRNWIALQFDTGLAWNNFGRLWQLDHIIPVKYFDQEDPKDLRLCWNFTNIKVEKMQQNTNGRLRPDPVTAKHYFENIFHETGYLLCYDMIRRIELLEMSQLKTQAKTNAFLLEIAEHLVDLQDFNEYEFQQLNTGRSREEIIMERKMLAKFGT